MSIEGEIYERSQAHTGLSALVGDRVYYIRAPENVTYPVFVYSPVTESNPARASATDGNLVATRFQLDGWTTDRDTARQLKNEIKAAYNRLSTDGSAAGTVIQDTYHDTTNVLYEDDTQVFHVVVDVEFWYEA